MYLNNPHGILAIKFKILQELRPLDKSTQLKIIFLFLQQNICCGHSEEPSQ